MTEHLEGLIAAPFTPMTADGRVDLDLIGRQADLLRRNGVAGAFVCGTTGEGLSLTVTEREQVAERWAATAGEGLKVIVQVGHNSVAEAKRLAAHAGRLGAWGIGAFSPCFYRPANVEQLVSVCGEIAAAAPELPFYYYHIPSMTGVDLPMVELLEAAAGRIDSLAGMKYAHEDLMDFGLCLRLDGGRYDVLFGRDEMLLGALALGAAGAVGSTYNFAAPLYVRLIEAFGAGDLAAARSCQHESMRLVRVLVRYGGPVVAGKAIMKLIGLDCGPCRLPLPALTDEQAKRLRADLERIGFFQYCSQ